MIRMNPPILEWPASYLSIANDEHDGVDNLATLLRRTADELEERAIDPIHILDVTVSQEFTDRPAWSVTVYWSDAVDEVDSITQ
jgi:hypothetical protein